MKNKTIEELRNDLSYYEKELEEYNNGVYDSYVRDLEYTIEKIKKEIQKIESKEVQIWKVGIKWIKQKQYYYI